LAKNRRQPPNDVAEVARCDNTIGRIDQTCTTLVVTYRPDNIAPDVKTQARAVLQYVFDRLAKRWTREQRDLPPLALSANT
jgi:hypothetical protein